MTNVTAKVTKSAGTATPAENPPKVRKVRAPVEPDAKTLTVRGAKRSVWILLRDALDGNTDAIATLFGTVAPAEPVRPILSDDDKSDPAKVLAHVEALDAYATAREAYPALLDAFVSANVPRMALRNSVNAAIEGIALRKREPKS